MSCYLFREANCSQLRSVLRNWSIQSMMTSWFSRVPHSLRRDRVSEGRNLGVSATDLEFSCSGRGRWARSNSNLKGATYGSLAIHLCNRVCFVPLQADLLPNQRPTLVPGSKASSVFSPQMGWIGMNDEFLLPQENHEATRLLLAMSTPKNGQFM